MALYHRLYFLFIIIFLASALGCASTYTNDRTEKHIDDSVITEKVKTAILQEPSLKFDDISVETINGVVQLSGHVSSRSEINNAVEVARRVEGVKTVRNDIVIKGQQ